MSYLFEDQEREMNVVTFDDMITLETIQKQYGEEKWCNTLNKLLIYDLVC